MSGRNRDGIPPLVNFFQDAQGADTELVGVEFDLHYVGTWQLTPTLCNCMAMTKRDQILRLFQQTRVLHPQDVKADVKDFGIKRP